jgi:multiple antibiotic resistance protein
VNAWAEQFLVALPAVFFVVDVFGVVPLFLGMTAGQPADRTRATALRACMAGAGLLGFFALFGGVLFKVLGITLPAFRVAGGLLLLVTALDMINARPSGTRTSAEEQREGEAKDDIALVPLAMPLLAGPGAIATVMVLMDKGGSLVLGVAVVLPSILLTFAVAYGVLAAAPLVHRVLKASGVAVLERVMGLVLAAIAVQFIADGAVALLRAPAG